MTTKKTAVIGGVAGLIVPGIVLTLLSWFGVWRIVRIGNTDLTHILWPSSAMLTVTWHTTVGGIMTTVASIAFNCLLYIAGAFLLRGGVGLVWKPRRSV